MTLTTQTATLQRWAVSPLRTLTTSNSTSWRSSTGMSTSRLRSSSTMIKVSTYSSRRMRRPSKPTLPDSSRERSGNNLTSSPRSLLIPCRVRHSPTPPSSSRPSCSSSSCSRLSSSRRCNWRPCNGSISYTSSCSSRRSRPKHKRRPSSMLYCRINNNSRCKFKPECSRKITLLNRISRSTTFRTTEWLVRSVLLLFSS